MTAEVLHRFREWRERPEHWLIDGLSLLIGLIAKEFAESMPIPLIDPEGIAWLNDGIVSGFGRPDATVVSMIAERTQCSEADVERALRALADVETVVFEGSMIGIRTRPLGRKPCLGGQTPRPKSLRRVRQAEVPREPEPAIVVPAVEEPRPAPEPVNSSSPKPVESDNSQPAPTPETAPVAPEIPEEVRDDARRNSQIEAPLYLYDHDQQREEKPEPRRQSGSLKIPDRKSSKTVRAPKPRAPAAPRKPPRASKPRCIVLGTAAEEPLLERIVAAYNAITAERRKRLRLPEARLTERLRARLRARIREKPGEGGREHIFYWEDMFVRAAAYGWLWERQDPATLAWLVASEKTLAIVRRHDPNTRGQREPEPELERPPRPPVHEVFEQQQRNEEAARRYYAEAEKAEATRPPTASQAMYLAMIAPRLGGERHAVT